MSGRFLLYYLPTRPPTVDVASSSTTLSDGQPLRRSSLVTVRPAMPAPTTTTWHNIVSSRAYHDYVVSKALSITSFSSVFRFRVTRHIAMSKQLTLTSSALSIVKHRARRHKRTYLNEVTGITRVGGV